MFELYLNEIIATAILLIIFSFAFLLRANFLVEVKNRKLEKKFGYMSGNFEELAEKYKHLNALYKGAVDKSTDLIEDLKKIQQENASLKATMMKNSITVSSGEGFSITDSGHIQ